MHHAVIQTEREIIINAISDYTWRCIWLSRYLGSPTENVNVTHRNRFGSNKSEGVNFRSRINWLTSLGPT